MTTAAAAAWRAGGYPDGYRHFATGFLFVGTFVYFLGLLIVSSKRYGGKYRALRHLVTVASGVAAL